MRTLNLEGIRPRCATWYRADRPIIAGLPVSPLMRAAITADFCNGNSVPLDPRAWSFINADLTLSLVRMPVGEWILLDAERWIGPAGTGIAFARLGDQQGYFGRAVQNLILERRDGTVATEMAWHVLAYNLTRVLDIVGIKPKMAAVRAQSALTFASAQDHNPHDRRLMPAACAGGRN